MKRAASLSIALAGLLACVVASADVPLDVPLTKRGYTLLTTRRNVMVYKHKKSGALALEGIFPGKPDKVLEALIAYDRHILFNKRLAYSKIFSRGKRWLLVYQQLELPVISNRDFTLYVSWGRRGQVRWVQFWTANSRGPKKRSGYVRVTTHRGGWKLKPLSKGRTFARYEVQIDLGGWVPSWLVRSGTKRELPHMFAGLKRLLETPPGRRAAAR